jgi:hypothetical protein
MNDSDPSSPSSPRRTLKLKVPARKPQEPGKSPPSPAVGKPALGKKTEQKPGAHWSDEYKRRMQADMDELNSGRD